MALNPLRRPLAARGTPLRWRPRMGPARCLTERVGQHLWRNRLAWYLAASLVMVLSFQVAFRGTP